MPSESWTTAEARGPLPSPSTGGAGALAAASRRSLSAGWWRRAQVPEPGGAHVTGDGLGPGEEHVEGHEEDGASPIPCAPGAP